MDAGDSPLNLTPSGPEVVLGPRKYVSDATYSLIMFIEFGVIMTTISTVGIIANVANVVTFFKMGFKETIDISLTALTMTDTASLTCLFFISITYTQPVCDLICEIIDIYRAHYLLGALPRAYFTIVSGCITSFVAWERCLCVLKPLEVKTLFTKKKVIIILVCIFPLTIGPFSAVPYTTGLGWVFNPETNRSILTLTYIENRHNIDLICFSLTVAMYLVTYLAVAVCAAIIVWKLSSQSAWRAGKGQGQGQGQSTKEKSTKSLSGKDRRATRTVIFIAVMYIVCFFPGALVQLLMSCMPEFNKGRLYDQIFDLSWAFAYISEAICSSANILVYLKTSSRFKEAFLGHFRSSSRPPK